MKILNFSSLNHEKGLNQSIALANAGASVYHAAVGRDNGLWIKKLTEHGVELIPMKDASPGEEEIGAVLDQFEAGDYLLVQNGFYPVKTVMKMAKERGMCIAFNPSPFSRDIFSYPLSHVDIFFINEVEGYQWTGEAEAEYILDKLQDEYPKSLIVLTLGERGACCLTEDRLIMQKARAVDAVDTTAAGDTFIGYFLAEYLRSRGLEPALSLAARASAFAVTRRGAADSIPRLSEVNGK